MLEQRGIVYRTIGLTIGTVVAYVDSRPTWDDTGVTAGILVLGAAVLGAVHPRRAWLTGLAVGLPMVVVSLPGTYHLGSLVAVAIAVAGAMGGASVGRALGRRDAGQVGSERGCGRDERPAG